MDTKKAAEKFASDWYKRTQQGCDEPTLALLLEDLIREAFLHGVEHERYRIKQRMIRDWGLS